MTPVPGTDLTERSADRNIVRISHGHHLVLPRHRPWPLESDHVLGRSEVSQPSSKPRRWRKVAPGLRKSWWERSGWRIVRYCVVIVTRPGGPGKVLYRDPGVAGVRDLAQLGGLGQPRPVLRLTNLIVTAFTNNISPLAAEQLCVITFQADLVLVLVVVLSLNTPREHWPAVLLSLLLLTRRPHLVRLVNVGLQALLSGVLALLLSLHQVGLAVWPGPEVLTGSVLLNSGRFYCLLRN